MEERMLYRVISGMHAAISTHISENYITKDGDKFPKLSWFFKRTGNH